MIVFSQKIRDIANCVQKDIWENVIILVAVPYIEDIPGGIVGFHTLETKKAGITEEVRGFRLLVYPAKETGSFVRVQVFVQNVLRTIQEGGRIGIQAICF